MKNNIIKIAALSLILALLFTACGNKADKAAEFKTVSEMTDESYSVAASAYGDNIYAVEFISEDGKDFQLVSCEMTEDEYAKAEEIVSSDGEYDEPLAEYLDTFGDKLNILSLADKIPDDSDMEKYKGKKISELEEAGFSQDSAGNDEDEYLYFVYADADYQYAVYPEGGYKELFSLPEDFTELEIEKIEFYNFSDATAFAFEEAEN